MKRIGRLFLLLLFLSFSQSGQGQDIFLHPLPQETIRIGAKYLRPYFSQDFNVEMKTLSGMYDAYLNMPFIQNYNLQVDVPLIIQAYNDETSGSGLGNLYLGLHSRPDSLGNIYTTTSLGIFLPTIKSSISALSFLGVYASFQEPQKAMSDVLTIYASYIYLVGEHYRKYFGFEIGPQYYIPIRASAATTSDLYAHYGISAGYALFNIMFTSELLGLVGLTSTYDTFSERVDHSLALAASFKILDWRPTVFYQIVIDDQASQIISGIFGAKLSLINLH
jgi:hypothetical protein